ncbi:MAG TPA: IS200/IS605 family transposase [Hanamia sp.]
MSHSYIKIWIHAIWATKNRQPMITQDIEKPLFSHMKEELSDCGCYVKIINGMPDHVHSLFSINAQKSIGDVIKQVKGGASHWVNQQNILNAKFAWQTGYAAYSVSESQLQKVFDYIKNQKEHHAKNTFQQEYENFIKLHHLENKGD